MADPKAPDAPDAPDAPKAPPALDPGDLPAALQRVRTWCARLQMPVKAVELQVTDGTSEPALEVGHGEHFLWALDRDGWVELVYPFYLPEEDVGRFEDLDEDELEAVLTSLEMLLLEGRSAYELHFDADGAFTGFSLSQALVPDPDDPGIVQRLADGVQELVVLGMRGAIFLGVPWLEEAGGTAAWPPGGPHPGMYG